MKLRKILLAIAGLALMLNASAQKSKRYYVPKPGTLVELMTEAEANEITQLTLQGKLNAVDFRHLRDEFKTCNCWTFPMPPSACMQQERDLSKPFYDILPIAFRHMPSASKWTTVPSLARRH